MDSKVIFNPTDQQALYRKMERIIAGYRDGQGGEAFFDKLDDISAEWERQGLPCGIPKHGHRDRFADSHS
jgi:hypothetical protein